MAGTRAVALIIGGPIVGDVVCLANVGFISTDVLSLYPRRAFEGRLEGAIETNTRVSCVFWGERSGFSISNIELSNTDGGLDYILDEGIRGQRIEVRSGDTAEKWEDWTLEFVGVVEDIDMTESDKPQLIIANAAGRLEVPFQQSFYANSANTAIAGKPLPKAIGNPLNIGPVLTDPTLLEYDTGATNVVLVRDNGEELTPTTQWTQSGGVITLLQDPVGKITADVEADGLLLADFIEAVIYSTGLTSGDIGDLGGADTFGWELGYWSDTPVTCAQVMDVLMDSYAGWWWFDNLGKLRAGYLQDPGTPVAVIGPNDFSDGFPFGARQDRMPGYSRIAAGAKNFFVHSPAEIANVLTSPTVTQISMDLQADYRVRRVGSTVIITPPDQEAENEKFDGARVSTRYTGIGTLLTDILTIAATADRWADLRAQRRTFYEFTLVLDAEDVRSIDIGDTITVTAPPGRFGARVGLDAKDVLIIGKKYILGDNVATFTAWA